MRCNKLGTEFGKQLLNCFDFDKYMKVIDLAHNRLNFETLKNIVGPNLRENGSILSLDVRFNPGTTN